MANKPPRLEWVFQSYDPPLFFVTFNTHQRKRLLTNSALHDSFVEFAKGGESHGISVGRYVIMPDHIHLFVRGDQNFILPQWIRMLKRALSTVIPAERPHWQTGFFDHLIRHSESYAEKWEYVHQNPVRAGLVAIPEEWPWQGEIARIEML